jgi:hypothetical protein
VDCHHLRPSHAPHYALHSLLAREVDKLTYGCK